MTEPTKCDLCPEPATDSTEIDTGNNAETRLPLNLCDRHMHECEHDARFQENHFPAIEQLITEREVSAAEAYGDDR